MVYVVKKKGETKEALFRKFTKTFIEEDIVTEIRDRMFYKKPSLLKKEKEKRKGKKPVRFFRHIV
ncbi:30S ribosomal protein S21 [Candidatus Roizmanbacteria bacterium]|nr:30S ribosomal protein S21 [Candidatus Roizmanbacteria bacterium]